MPSTTHDGWGARDDLPYESRGSHAHVQAATLVIAVVDCEPNIVVVMSRFVRGLFQTARTISTIDPTAPAF